MADIIRIKRRASGAPGAPGALTSAELAYNEVDHTLYYGEGNSAGAATSIVAIGGQGLASSLSPNMDGAAAVGTATTWARADHRHPTDTTLAPLASPALTGTPTAPTVTPGTDNSTKIATTAFVQSAISAVSSGVTNITAGAGLTGGGSGAVTIAVATNGITNALAAQMNANTIKGNNTGAAANAADLTVSQVMTLLAAAPLASPIFTGTPAAPTPANGTNTTQIATTAFVLATRLDQLAAPTANISINSHQLNNVLDPTSPQDAATKNYVDGVAQGLDAKASVQVATTGSNITLSGTQTIDGVAIIAGARVLVKDQTTTANNGIYVCAAGAWSRSTDMDAWTEVPDAFCFVEQGTTNSDTGWVCTSDAGGTLNTTAITWVQFSSAGVITAGNGLTKAGNQLSVVGTVNRISVGASVDISASYVGQSSITTLGTITTGVWNGTTIAVANGGTGATTAPAALTALGAAPAAGSTSIITLGTIATGTWNGSVIGSAYGGLGAASLTGYLYGNGASAATASTTIPNTSITGLGTMSTQNASAVAITGGTIDGVTFDGGTF